MMAVNRTIQRNRNLTLFDKIKNYSLLKKSILVLLVLFFIESIVFQVVVIIKFNDFQYHNHILDEGSILTYDELTDKKAGLFDISDDYCIKVSRVGRSGNNTIIDAILVNTSGVNLSGVHFYIQTRTLTDKGRQKQTGHMPFSRKDFEDDDLCTDLKNLSVNDINISIKPGKPETIQIVIKNYKISKDDILNIRGYCKYILY